MERISPLPPREDLQVVIKSASFLSENILSVYCIKSFLLASIPSIESQISKPTIDIAKNIVPKENITIHTILNKHQDVCTTYLIFYALQIIHNIKASPSITLAPKKHEYIDNNALFAPLAY